MSTARARGISVNSSVADSLLQGLWGAAGIYLISMGIALLLYRATATVLEAIANVKLCHVPLCKRSKASEHKWRHNR